MEDIKVYVMLDDEVYGCAYTNDKCIKLNYNSIKKILNVPNHENNPESLHIFETIFH